MTPKLLLALVLCGMAVGQCPKHVERECVSRKHISYAICKPDGSIQSIFSVDEAKHYVGLSYCEDDLMAVGQDGIRQDAPHQPPSQICTGDTCVAVGQQPGAPMLDCTIEHGCNKLCADQHNNPIQCKGAGAGYQWIAPDKDKPHLVICHWKTNTMLECDGWAAPMTIETANLPKPEPMQMVGVDYARQNKDGHCVVSINGGKENTITDANGKPLSCVQLLGKPMPSQLPMSVPAIKVVRAIDPNCVACPGTLIDYYSCPDESWELHVSVNGKIHWCSRPPVLEHP